MPKILVNDINIYYELRGEGHPLVMIMGLAGNSDWWSPRLIEGLAQNYQLLIFDNRGARRSDAPESDYSLQLFAKDTVGLMQSLGIKRAHIFGFSMGGMIAQEIALSYPDRVSRLVFGCTHCGPAHSIPPSPEVMALLSKRDYSSLDEFFTLNLPILFPTEFMAQYPDVVADFKKRFLIAPMRPSAYFLQLEAVSRFSSFDRLGRIQKSTLILAGEKDVLVLPENSAVLARNIPGSQLIYLEGCGHLFFDQVPEKISRILHNFLK